MSVTLALLHKLVAEETPPAYLYERGITDKDFPEQEGLVFRFIEDYFNRYGEMPNRKTIEVELNGFKFPSFPDNPLDYWTDQFLGWKRQKQVRALVRELTDLVQANDINGAEELILQSQSRIATSGNGNVEQITSLPKLSAEIMERHDVRARNMAMSGIPFGFPFLDKESEADGAQGGDFITVLGRPGMGKTWFMAHLALAANRSGAHVLMASYEMSLLQVGTRLLSCAYGVPASRFRTGRLGTIARNQLSSILQGNLRLSEKDVDLILAATSSGRVPSLQERRERFLETRSRAGFRHEVQFDLIKGTLSATVEELISVTQALNPDVLFVDGAYLLQTTRSTTSRNDRYTITAEMLKQLGQYLEIPVFATYQLNREGAKKAALENIYMSDAMAQLSSFVLSIEDDPDAETDMSLARLNTKKVSLLKAREIEKNYFRVVLDVKNAKIYEYKREESDYAS